MPAEERWMKEAIMLATANVTSGRGGPFGAVIVRDGEVIGRGANGVTATNDPTAHAEIVAIRDACARVGAFELAGAEIYSSCEPCPMCLAAIYWARCAGIYFGNTAEDAAAAGFDDAYLYGEMKKDVGERNLPAQGMMRAEALASFAAWNEFVGRVAY